MKDKETSKQIPPAEAQRRREVTLGYFACLYGLVLMFLLLDNIFWYARHSQAWRVLYMFTNQANLIMMFWLFWFGITRFIRKDSKFKRVASAPLTVASVTLYITIVFLVVALVLSPFYRAAFADHLVGILIFTHLVSTVVMFAFFFLVREGDVKRAWLASVYMLLYPLTFLVMNFAIGFTTGSFSYDFMDPSNYPNAGLYSLTLVGFGIGFWALGFLILRLQRFLNRAME